MPNVGVYVLTFRPNERLLYSFVLGSLALYIVTYQRRRKQFLEVQILDIAAHYACMYRNPVDAAESVRNFDLVIWLNDLIS